MAVALTIRTQILSALLAAAIGIETGRSTVAEINPLYFTSLPHPERPPQSRWRAAMGRGPGCIGCRTYPEDYRPPPDPGVEALFAPASHGSATPQDAPAMEAEAHAHARLDEDIVQVPEAAPAETAPDAAAALQALSSQAVLVLQ